MATGGSVAINRGTSYYLVDGRRQTGTLTGQNGQVQLSYTYQPDGLPATLGMTGIAGAWNSSFDYDNLGRLTFWKASDTSPPVRYSYEPDGTLLERDVGIEIATYTSSPTGYSVTVSHDVDFTTDSYQSDAFGRIYSTPSASVGYDGLDRIISVIERTNPTQPDRILHDGTGRRVLAKLGSGADVLTLDNWFEQRGTSGSSEGRIHLQAGGAVVGDIVRSTGALNRTATMYLEDNVGSVVAEASVHDGSGVSIVTTRSRRDPYGNLIADPQNPYLPADGASADPDGSSRDGFAGHARDAGWGFIDMMARGYSPRLGRFMSADPVIARPFDRTSHNPFSYARNSPTALNDPDGRFWKEIGRGLVAIVETAVGAEGGGEGTTPSDSGDDEGASGGAAGADTTNVQNQRQCPNWRCSSPEPTSSTQQTPKGNRTTSVPYVITGYPTASSTSANASGSQNRILRTPAQADSPDVLGVMVAGPGGRGATFTEDEASAYEAAVARAAARGGHCMKCAMAGLGITMRDLEAKNPTVADIATAVGADEVEHDIDFRVRGTSHGHFVLSYRGADRPAAVMSEIATRSGGIVVFLAGIADGTHTASIIVRPSPDGTFRYSFLDQFQHPGGDPYLYDTAAGINGRILTKTQLLINNFPTAGGGMISPALQLWQVVPR
jgi:RHS repeat-associated protein